MTIWDFPVTTPFGQVPGYPLNNGFHNGIAKVLTRWYDYGMKWILEKGEKFKPVPGFNGLYEISNYGALKRLPSGKIGAKRSVTIGYPQGSFSHKGYRVYKLYSYTQDKVQTLPAHRLVARAFLPNPNNLPQVNHKDGNKLNNHVDNLEWCDNTFNINHAILNGLQDNRGEKSGVNKYPEKLIRLVLETRETIRPSEFAKTHGLTTSYVCNIRAGRRWRWLWEQYNG